MLKADELFLKTKRQVDTYKLIVSLLIFRTHVMAMWNMAILLIGAVNPKPFNAFYPTKRFPFGLENFLWGGNFKSWLSLYGKLNYV